MATDDLIRDDAKCREAFRRGERWAMAMVYETYLPLVRTVVVHGFGGFRGFHDPLDREDAIQNVFAAAFEERSRLRYNGLDPYAAYLRGIAQNVVRRMLEKRARFDRGEAKADPEPIPLEEAVIDRELCAILARFRESISDPRERAVLQRYFCDGLSEEALAAELSLTRYRVRKIIAKLDRRMRKTLKAHGIDTP